MQITSAMSFSCCIVAAENCRVQNARGNLGVSFAEVHEAPSTHRGRKNYGAVDTKVRDQPSPSLDDSDRATENAASALSSLATSCESFVRPAKFFIGTPRDSEGSSIPRTGFAQNADQQESVSDTETGDWDNRIPAESTALLSKPYCPETDKI